MNRETIYVLYVCKRTRKRIFLCSRRLPNSTVLTYLSLPEPFNTMHHRPQRIASPCGALSREAYRIGRCNALFRSAPLGTAFTDLSRSFVFNLEQ
jgi:hypothetical protein